MTFFGSERTDLVSIVSHTKCVPKTSQQMIGICLNEFCFGT